MLSRLSQHLFRWSWTSTRHRKQALLAPTSMPICMQNLPHEYVTILERHCRSAILALCGDIEILREKNTFPDPRLLVARVESSKFRYGSRTKRSNYTS